MQVDELFHSLCHSLNAKETHNGEFRCQCPAHSDTDPSLFLTLRSGKILLHCFGGCSQDSVVSSLRARGLWTTHEPAPVFRAALPPGIPLLWPPASILRRQNMVPSSENQKVYRQHHPYRDASGHIIGHVVRYDGHGKKDLIPFFKKWDDGTDWKSGHTLPSGRPLYALEKLAKFPSLPVIVVEGEKCADFGNRLGSHYPVFCTWPGGSNSARRADWTPLSSRHVSLWMDLDAPGVKAMNSIAKLLVPIVASLSVVNPNALGITILGGDICDVPSLTEEALLAATSPYTTGCFARFFTESGLQTPKKKTLDSNKTPPPSAPPPDPVPVSSHALTDLGNAYRLEDRFGSQLRFTPEHGWYRWRGTHWSHDSLGSVFLLAGSVAEGIRSEALNVTDTSTRQRIVRWSLTSQSHGKIKAMVSLASSLPSLATNVTIFDRDPFLLACRNGTLDLRTGELSPHSPSHYCSRSVPFDFNPSAVSPLWNSFLARIFENNVPLIDYLRRAIGYSLTGSCEEQCLFFLHGRGQNGKTVLMETIKHLMSDYALQTDTNPLLLDSRGDPAAQTNSIARMRGARLVLGSEIKEGARLNEARIKELTGQDTISARFLFREFFEFIPTFKLWLRCNDLPTITGTDLGIWRRIHCIPFSSTISATERDPKLASKLLSELPGIFSWAVSGALEWQRIGGLCPPPEVAQANRTYRRDMDPLQDWFDDCVILDPDSETRSLILYESYRNWCKDAGEHYHSHRWLSLRLRSRGFRRTRSSTVRAFRGIRLRNDGIRPNSFSPPHPAIREEEMI